MKKIKIYQIVGALFMFALVLGIFSCSTKEDLPGQPKLNSITTNKDFNTPIAGGNMGDWIAIHGENIDLANVSKVEVNDVSVALKDIYYENKVLYLQVPVVMPKTITDKIKVTTVSGTVDYNFKVTIPNLTLTGMFNEYIAPNDTLKIYGKFFKLYEVDKTSTVVSFNGTESPVIDASDNYLTVKVPQNAPANIKLKVIDKKYNISVDCPGYYQDRQFLITNFDDVPYNGSDGANYVGTWTNPKPISGKYSLLKVGPAASGWMYMLATGVDYTQDMKDNPDKYVVKFELNMLQPFVKTIFYIYNYWAYDPAAITASDIIVQKYGVWQTVSIPLEKIIPKDFTGDKSNIGSFNIRVESPDGETIAMGWDNFRISKKD